jgi:recombination protein RecA
MAIDDVLANLDAKTRARVASASEISIEKQETPSVALNIGLNGGLAYGRQTLLWGNKSAGKSTFCMGLIAKAQERGKSALWIDAERTFDPLWAEKHGVDTKALRVSEAASVSSFVDDSINFMKAGIDIIVVDSITALLPASYYADKDELKDFEKTGQIGGIARDLSRAIPMISGVNEKTLVIFISQQRNMINSMYTAVAPTGGFAPKFYSSTIIKLWSSDSDGKAIKGEIQSGDKILQGNIGREVQWEIQNNKLGPQSVMGKYDFYYRGDNLGIDSVGEIVDLSEAYGLIAKSGAWYKFNGQTLQGRTGVVKYLRENKTEAEALIKEIYEKSR